MFRRISSRAGCAGVFHGKLLDEERLRRLENKTVLNYIRKGRGGIYGKASDKHGLSPLDAALKAKKLYPRLFERWWRKLEEIDESRMCAILQRVPLEWMSTPARDFALAVILGASIQ
jgi:hypothetical protein